MSRLPRRPEPPLRTLLFAAYHFPPMRSAGVERAAKFARYLPEFGYAPRVLTTSAFGGTSSHQVLRAPDPVGLYRRLLNAAARRDRVAATRERTVGPQSGLLAWVRDRLLVPDGQITWLPAAALTALRSLRRDGADLILTTAPPVSTHLLGAYLQGQTGLPWVADFRDSWLGDPLDPALLTRPRRRELERRLEERVVGSADLIVAATETSASDLRRRYPAAAARVRVVTNGFDPEDDGGGKPEGQVDGAGRPTEPLEGPRRDRRLRLVHTGSFAYSHPLRSPRPLLQALGRLVELEPAWRERLELTLVGQLAPDERASAAALVEAGVVRLAGAVDHATALGYQRRADLLLVVDHMRPWPASNVPGKLYEYLAAGKPILALCGPGEVAHLVTELAAGWCVAGDDVDAIEGALRQAWAAHLDGSLPRAPQGLARFHRRELSRQLARLFDEVLADR